LPNKQKNNKARTLCDTLPLAPAVRRRRALHFLLEVGRAALC